MKIAKRLNSDSNAMESENTVIDLMPMISAVWQRKWRLMLFVAMAMSLAYYVLLHVDPTYESKARLLIQEPNNNPVSIEKAMGVNDSSDYFDNQIEMLKSRVLAEKVVRTLSLDRYKEFDFFQQKPLINYKAWLQDSGLVEQLPESWAQTLLTTRIPSEEARFSSVVDMLMSRVRIDQADRGNIANISVQLTDAEMTAIVANTYAREFIDAQLDASMEQSVVVTDWMNKRVKDLKDELKASEIELQKFKDSKGLIDIGGITTISAEELASINQMLVEARSRRAEAESQYMQVRQIPRDDVNRLATVPAVLSHPLIQEFKAEEARVLSKLEELAKRYGPMHPKIQAASSEVRSVQASLQTQVSQIVASIEKEFQIARANELSLQRSVQKNKNQVRNISKHEYKLRELQREVDTNRALFETFMKNFKQSTATLDLDKTNARLIDPAVVPVYPIKPKKMVIIILAGLLAGLIGVGMVVISQVVDKTFRGIEDIEDSLGVKVLGLLPRLKVHKKSSVAEHYINRRNLPFIEAVKSIRTSLVLANIDNPRKRMVVTSSIPGEGKSTVSTNLALAMSEVENVLIIEADMRRPTFSKVFSLDKGRPGLSNLIVGTSTFKEVVTRVETVDVITAGSIPSNPLELLMSDRFATILKALDTKYDRIIIDSPPVNAVSDVLLLGALSESLIYVMRPDHTNKQDIERGLTLLEQNNVNIDGVVLNQVDVAKDMKRGITYGGHYDYYGYGSSTLKQAQAAA